MCDLEKNKLIFPIQNGFRKNRSTIDHLVRFESLGEASIKTSIQSPYSLTEKNMILLGNTAYCKIFKTYISKDIYQILSKNC